MAYLKINNVDVSSLVSDLKVDYETLVSDNSGRNANGDTVIDIINHKIKLTVGLRHTTQAEMQSFLSAIESYTVQVDFLNPKDNQLKHITCYTGTPSPEYYTISDKTIFKPMDISLIEL